LLCVTFSEMYTTITTDMDESKEEGGWEKKVGDETKGEERVGVTRYRWVVLAIFSFLNLVNSIEWICFGM
jgi:hypothetical protein